MVPIQTRHQSPQSALFELSPMIGSCARNCPCMQPIQGHD